MTLAAATTTTIHHSLPFLVTSVGLLSISVLVMGKRRHCGKERRMSVMIGMRRPRGGEVVVVVLMLV